ncbi:twitching motility protein PilT [Betaproteobacteria bacterium]|nr:twitching motility protein PilT [Betaproteobacteria bacterium]GHU01039.1 twitching motility protein PilT [Betaproteobacteria bacterium]GHU23695.1 twitching motility protein PilT [Betaproteobacteria bacterium]GHU39902.1 twitching motility protein PilT [Betaproteobacteria bacterium]
MKFLLDTHLLIWAVTEDRRLSVRALNLITDTRNEIFFSVLSLWEIAIKRGQNRADFLYEPRAVRRALLDNGYQELPILSQHVVDIDSLPPIHKDPFDRLLIAQAMAEGITLLTADATVAQYSGPIQLVR